MAEAISDLAALLGGLDPERHPGEYVFCTVPSGADADRSDRHRVRAVVVVHEAEGKTLVVEAGEAVAAGLPDGPRFVWITLRVHSALEAVGLTAAVAGALAAEGIACNMVAGFFHDHLFVPASRADDTLAILAALASP